MALIPAEHHRCSSSTNNYLYDVFLSYKGKDTRKTFTDHLQTSLLQLGIRTFTNIRELGEMQRHQAITRSRFSVIVVSKNYAYSNRCLDELVMIIECRKRFGQFVLPVFHRLDPSDILKQCVEIGADSDARSEAWRSALEEVAKMASDYRMISHHFAEGYEAKFVQKIVSVIEDKLRRPLVRVARYPIGIDFRARHISLWLQQKSTDVEVLVICGMGGIGKTTIAKHVFNLHFRRFECSSFLANVRETCEQLHGLVHLQNQLLSNLLKGERPKIWNVDEGIIKIKESLWHKTSLLVLDDVDEMYQLDALIGNREFNAGSKIIITTRNKQFLRDHNVYRVHTVEKLDHNESLELFSWHAFGKMHPGEGYMDLSERVLHRCLGIPLALVILGSSLAGRSTTVWTSALEKLEAIPDAEIKQTLKISYDCLQDDHDRNLFLHIACFFIGEDKDCVGKILDKCDFFSVVGIQNLIDRCLLTIELGSKLMMHHLVQEMAREIVRKESPTLPGERSRLWHHDDSFSVLKEKSVRYILLMLLKFDLEQKSVRTLMACMYSFPQGTERIQGLMLDMHMFNKDNGEKPTSYGRYSRKRPREMFSNNISFKRCHITLYPWERVHSFFNCPNEMELETDAFAKLVNLKLLRLNHVQLNGCYDSFPGQLRWLRWHGFHRRNLPNDLHLRNLVSLDMSYSNLERVWERTKLHGCLKILNLSYSQRLIETPDFTGLPNLEKLLLKGRVRLIEISKSISECKDLTLLDVEDCKNLISLPQTLWRLRFLETLVISGCSSLREFPIELRNMKSLKELRANGVNFINPSPTVATKNKWRYPFVWAKPHRNPDILWASLPRSLVKLRLANSNLKQDSFPKCFSNLPFLAFLDLSENPLSGLPESVRSLKNLVTLDLSSCPKQQLLLDVPSSLEDLRLDNCISLERITNLSRFALPYLLKHNCRKLVEVEGYFQLKPIAKVNQEIIKELGLTNVEFIGNLEVHLNDGFSYYNGNSGVQGLFQYGIFSTFIPSEVVPCWFNENKVKASSVTVTIPLDAMVKCLNICCVYGDTYRHSVELWSPHPAFTKIHNITKNLTWIYCPIFFALPHHQDLAWLSQWKFGNHLENGDEVTISFIFWDAFQVKECGVSLVSINQGDETVVGDLLEFEQANEVGVVGGDLSEFELTEGIYFIIHERLRNMIGLDDWTSTQWFQDLFGDSPDAIDALIESWDG